MRKILVFLFLAPVLTACGRETIESIAVSPTQPSYDMAIPADSIAYDYSCDEVREFRRRGDATLYSTTDREEGISYQWEGDSGLRITFSIASNDEFRDYNEARMEKLSDARSRSTGRFFSWARESDGSWSVSESAYERIWERAGSVRKIIANVVNGKQQPYYWTVEDFDLNDRDYRTIHRHIDPSVRNSGDFEYTKIENTCDYRLR